MASGTTLFPVALYIPLAKEPDIRPVDHSGLFWFRNPQVPAVQGVPFWRLVQTVPPEPEPQPIQPASQLLFRFRSAAPAAPPGQPFWIWPRVVGSPEPEPLPRQPDHTTLNRYRVGFQTVGQSYWLWPRTVGAPTPEPFPVFPDSQALLRFRNQQIVLPPQPFFIWPRLVGAAEIEPLPRPVDQQLLYRFRNPQIVSATVMPNLVGLNYYMALEVLQDAGIYLPLVVYAFEPSSITVQWIKSPLPGGIVAAQSLAAGLATLPGQALTLTVSQFPFGSMIDSPPDWKQRH